MSKLTKREMAKIIKRLDYIYEKLDGTKKTGPISSNDEFTNIQNNISEQIVALRNKIQQKKRLEKSRENFIEVTKLKQQIALALADLESSHNRLTILLNKLREDKKVPGRIIESRGQIVAKFEQIIGQLRASVDGAVETEETPMRPNNVLKLADIKNGQFGGRKEMEFRIDDTYDERDDAVIKDWQEWDKKTDDKLDDVNLLLGEIKLMSENLGREIDNRNELVNMANTDAAQANKALEIENNRLTEVLKKYRAPSKLCMDICLCLLLLGLITVIIMLIKNGK
jgi:hypothetical protein